MLLIEDGKGGEEGTCNRKERQANHTERLATYLHIMVRIGLVNEISQVVVPEEWKLILTRSLATARNDDRDLSRKRIARNRIDEAIRNLI